MRYQTTRPEPRPTKSPRTKPAEVRLDELMAAEGVGRSVSVDDAVLRLTS